MDETKRSAVLESRFSPEFSIKLQTIALKIEYLEEVLATLEAELDSLEAVRSESVKLVEAQPGTDFPTF